MKRAIALFAVFLGLSLVGSTMQAGVPKNDIAKRKQQIRALVQSKRETLQKRKLLGLKEEPVFHQAQPLDPLLLAKASAASVLVDSMANVLAFLGNNRNQIAYDPTSTAIVIVHRGFATTQRGSGFIYYNASTDGGLTFSPGLGDMNAGLPAQGRYPGITLLNPDGQTDPNDPNFTGRPVLIFPILDATLLNQWGRLVNSYDVLFGLGIPTAAEIPRSEINARQFLIPYMYENNEAGNANFGVFTDFNIPASNASTEQGLFESTDGGESFQLKSIMVDTSEVEINGIDEFSVSYGVDGIGYGMALAVVKGDDDFETTYIKTADGGATWSAPVTVPISSIQGLESYNVYTTFDHDAIVVNSVPYFVTAFGDTNSGSVVTGVIWSGDGGATWAGQAIAEIDTLTWTYVSDDAGGVQDQEYHLAKDANGNVYVQYIDAGVGGVPDIYVAAKARTAQGFGAPANVSNSAAIELMVKMAPWATAGASNGTVHLTYLIPQSINTATAGLERTPIYYLNATLNLTSVAERPGEVPNTFALRQNYPNPFNPSTAIQFSLRVSEQVKLEVYNMIGQKVATLVNGKLAAGNHTINWDAQNEPSGIYFYKLEAANFSQIRKMILMK
ncbi:MAG: T9SS type A sorting domain-containing protein [bacterium]